jgi:hypothetical protein
MTDEEDDREYCLCEHEESHSDHSIWVKPSPSERIHSPAQKRPYCKKCGTFKYLGSAPTKKMGFYINILNEVQRKIDVLDKRKITKHRLTQVQMRLILKELNADDEFNDRFSNNRYNQWNRFKEVLKKYCDIDEELVDSIYRDFKG